jgi:hypothetical protein
MNNTFSEEKSKLLLKGRANYLMWHKRIIEKLQKEKIFSF